MSGECSRPAGLLEECSARGISLTAAGKDRIAIDAPREALTDEFMERLRASKTALLEALRSDADSTSASQRKEDNSPGIQSEAACLCGSKTWQDVPIHNGQSVRRDCALCKRFIAFTVWYGTIPEVKVSIRDRSPWRRDGFPN